MRSISFTILVLAATCNCMNGFHNGSFYEVDSEHFRKIAKETYAKVIPCIESAWMMEGHEKIQWEFPKDAYEHYEQLKEATIPYRKAPVHEYSGYEGPWIENIFISHYLHRPLHFFGGFIPLFIQWIDTQILRGRYFDYIEAELKELLRPNVLYIAISQGDVGLGKIGRAHPNILVLSAGGYGHVPIPLIKSHIALQPTPLSVLAHGGLNSAVDHSDESSIGDLDFDTDIAFYGSLTGDRGNRAELLNIVAQEAQRLHLSYKQDISPDWETLMGRTRFNLAPRGYGRSSFRFAECIQMGRIPVFMHGDLPWVPYEGTELDASNFGFVAGKSEALQMNNISAVMQEIKDMSEKEFARRMQVLKEVRWFYTYHGVVHEIDLFLKDPFGPNGGHFRCTTHPRTERCCG